MYFYSNIPTSALVIFGIVLVAIYITCSLVLYNYNKVLYKKRTVLAWIPITNLYILGKLCFNRLSGWLTVMWLFLLLEVSLTINYREYNLSIIPSGAIKTVLSIIYIVILLIMYIYIIIKYYSSNNK